MNLKNDIMNEDYYVQSVLFDYSKVTMNDALFWVIQHHYNIRDVKQENQYFKFKICKKSVLRKYGFRHFIKKVIDENRGIILILAYKDNPNRKSCFSLPSFC